MLFVDGYELFKYCKIWQNIGKCQGRHELINQSWSSDSAGSLIIPGTIVMKGIPGYDPFAYLKLLPSRPIKGSSREATPNSQQDHNLI